MHADNIKIIQETTLCIRDAFYIVYDNGNCLICTQCLGHNGITGIKPDKTIIDYTEEDNVRILLGSDGLFDMIIKQQFNDDYLEQDLLAIIDLPGEVILNRAIKRWMQEWRVCDINNISETTIHKFEKQECDDVCVVVIDIPLGKMKNH
jgi:serine/threonine protein phosphatase PrpC